MSFVAVTVQVPEDRLAEFHSMYGRWLAGESLDGPIDDFEDQSASQLRRWSVGDADCLNAAIGVYENCSAMSRKMLDHLIDRPGQDVENAELAGLFERANAYSVASSMNSLVVTSKHRGHVKPFRWRPREDGVTVYWLDAEVAELFSQAREQAHR